MDPLTPLAVRTAYPCCGKRALLRAIPGVPRERYERVCDACDTRWEVARRLVVTRDGMRIDVLDWVDRGPAGAR